MNLHEYQAKQILAEYGLPVPKYAIAHSAEEAMLAAKDIGGQKWVVKAQVHAGGRGKAGGVKIVDSLEAVETVARSLYGKRLVTYQTDANGQPINTLLVEQPSNIARELYLGVVIDRSLQKVVIMASTAGGVDIELVAAESPETIHKIIVDPLLGVMPYQARQLAFALQLTAEQQQQFIPLLMNFGKMFVENDLSMVEINPLVVTKEGALICLDAKINIDDNALFRQAKLWAMRDITQEDARENRARDWELNYIALDGDIGCMVNGAGLAMATMDVIKLHGGNPANFLDVGGSATKERVTEALKIILSDANVKGILVNIFGGIVRCDLIAEGIIQAAKDVNVHVPVVVRLEGNNAQKGADMLKSSGMNLIPARDLTDAAQKIIAAVRK